MNSKPTYTLIFLLSFMASMETHGYEVNKTTNSFQFSKVQVDQNKEEIKKVLQSTSATIIKRAYTQAALLKSNIVFLKTIQYQETLVAQGYDLHSTGTSKNTIKIALEHLRYSTSYSDFKTTLYR